MLNGKDNRFTGMNKYKTLLSNTMLISMGTFGSKILVFFMVRFYTGYLTPEDYGIADLITQTANLLFPIISFGITEGVFRFAVDNERGRRSIFTVGVRTITAGMLLFIGIVPLLYTVRDFRGYIWLIVLYTMACCYHTHCAQFVRATGNTALFAVQGILNTALVVGFNILFLAVAHIGVTGYVLSVALADLLSMLFLFKKEKLWTRFTPHPAPSTAKRMLHYSIPLIPTTIFWWITSVSDRYMVKGFIGGEANGIYAVSYKIPTILTLISSLFMQAWQFSAVAESHGDKEEHTAFFSEVWRSFQAVMFIAGAFIIAFAKPAIRLLSTEKYYEAWQYVPLLSCAMIFTAFASFTGTVYIVTKKSKISFWTAFIGAASNLVMNFCLIPSPLGVQGAAIATVGSYLLVFIIRAINSRRYIPFCLYGGNIAVNTALVTLQTVFAVTEWHGWMIVQGVCIIALCAVNAGFLWPVFRKVLSLIRPVRKRDETV